MQDDTKKCPYCAEEIKKEAIFCKHCRKNLPKEKPPFDKEKARKEKEKVYKDLISLFIVIFVIIFAAGLLMRGVGYIQDANYKKEKELRQKQQEQIKLAHEIIESQKTTLQKADEKAQNKQWKEAIEDLKTIPQTDKDFDTAQKKIAEYSEKLEKPEDITPKEPVKYDINQNYSAQQWYEKGTLHNAQAGLWHSSSYDNRLATSADFVSAIYSRSGKTFNDMAEMKLKSVEMEACITSATNDTSLYNQQISEIAALCAIQLGY